jgi:hypothetical protein
MLISQKNKETKVTTTTTTTASIPFGFITKVCHHGHPSVTLVFLRWANSLFVNTSSSLFRMYFGKGYLLRLAALFAALRLTLARYQASIICEYGGIRTQTRSTSALYACDSGCYNSIDYTPLFFSNWNGHLLTELYGVSCPSGKKAGICYQSSSGSWYITDSCAYDEEAVITIVNDSQRRRLGAPEPEEDLEEFEEEVEIDGSKWTVYGTRPKQE